MGPDGIQVPGANVIDATGSIVVDIVRCTGCGRCVAACNEKLLTLDLCGTRKTAVIRNAERCNLCGKCVSECLVGAMKEAEPRELPP